MADYWARTLPAEDLLARIAQARTLTERPLEFHLRSGTPVWVVANRSDRISTSSQMERMCDRLRAAGANATLLWFDDVRGHTAFFRTVPSALNAGLRSLVDLRP
jgi:hypothetical protein